MPAASTWPTGGKKWAISDSRGGPVGTARVRLDIVTSIVLHDE